MYSRQHCCRIRRNDQGHLRKNQGYQRHAHGLAGMADESQNAGRRTLKLLLHRAHDGGIIGCPKKGQLLLPVPEQYSIVQYLVKLPVLCYIRPDEAFSNDWGLGLHTA